MKKIGYILLFVFAASTIAGTPQPSKKVEIEGGGTYTFDGIEIENTNSVAYKTLEIRYVSSVTPSQKEIEVEGQTYKFFRDKRSAISYYNIVKATADKQVVYYVNSHDTKTPEVFTFRVSSKK